MRSALVARLVGVPPVCWPLTGVGVLAKVLPSPPKIPAYEAKAVTDNPKRLIIRSRNCMICNLKKIREREVTRRMGHLTCWPLADWHIFHISLQSNYRCSNITTGDRPCQKRTKAVQPRRTCVTWLSYQSLFIIIRSKESSAGSEWRSYYMRAYYTI